MATQKTNIWIDGSQAGATYRELQKEVNKLNREIKDLPRNSEEYTKKVKELANANKAIGEHRAQVKGIAPGFDDAKRSIKGMLQEFAPMTAVFSIMGAGIAGIFQGVRSGINGIVEFDTALADLSAVTGANAQSMKFFQEQAIEFSSKYGESAADIATAFKLAGSARPELLKNSAAMADLTEKAIILSKASGDDVPTSIANLTGTLNAFDMPASKAGEVMDTLANAAKEGAQEIPWLAEGFTKFGGVAAAAGIQVSESAAAMEILGLKIPEASTAGLNLKNVMLTLQKTAADQKRPFQGFTKELELMKPKVNDVNFMLETFGRENLAAAQQLINSTDKLSEMTAKLDENGTAQEQAAKNSNTISEAWSRLAETFKNQFLGLENSSGSLVKALDWIRENIDLISTAIGKAIKFYVLFKTTMLAMQLKQRATEWIALNKEVKASGENMKSASSGVKGFGAALKGAGIAAGIALVQELGAEIWDVVSGARMARYEIEQMEKGKTKGSNTSQNIIGKYQQMLQDKTNEINLNKNLTDKQRAEAIKKETEAIKQKITLKAIEVRQMKEETDAALKKNAAKYKEAQSISNLIFASKEELKQASETIGNYGTLKQASAAYGTILTDLRGELNTLNQSTVDQTVALQNSSSAMGENTSKTKKQKDAYAAMRDELAKLIMDIDALQAQNQQESRIAAMEEGQAKELEILKQNLEEKYASEMAVAERLMKDKGEVGIKATEQYNRLIQLKDLEYAEKSKEITERFAKEAAEKDYETFKDNNLKKLAQQESLEDALIELRVAKAQAAYKAVNEWDIQGKKFAAAELKMVLEQQLDHEKTRKIEALYDQYDAEAISMEELNARKLALEEDFLNQKEALNNDSAEKISSMNRDKIEMGMQQVQQFIDLWIQFETQRINKEIKGLEKAKKADEDILDEKLRNKEISEEEYNDRKETIETEFEEKKAKLQNELAKKRKNAAIAEAVINGVQAVMKIFASTAPPASYVLAALQAGITAAQIGLIANQDVEQYAEGGYTDVIGKKDGLRYRAKNVGRLQGGMTPSNPSLALISEQGPEYFVPYHLMRDQRVANHVAMIDAIRTNQFADGGYTTNGRIGISEDMTAVIQQNTSIMALLAQKIPEMKATVDEHESYKVVKKAVSLGRNRG